MAGSTYILREALPDESGRLFAAIQKWADPFVLGRPESELRAAAESGFFFVVTDEHDEILALSAVFTLRETEYVETGNTFVDERLRGFGIQALFFQLRIATVFWSEGTRIKITTAIDPTNHASLKNKDAAGFTPMDPIVEQLAPCTGCKKKPPASAPHPCCCQFYVLPVERARTLVANLIARTQAGVVELSNRHGEKLSLTVRARIASDPDARTALESYAHGADW